MKQQQRLLAASIEGYAARTEKYQDRDHLAVPVVALVEDVVFAANADNPEFVSFEEFSKAPLGWNGRPIFLGHPTVDGYYVFGNTPGLLERDCIGTVFNSGIKDRKLVMEAWIDTTKAPADLITRVGASETIEISIGAFVETDDVAGHFAGKDYVGRWSAIVPDHLALLPEGSKGACSVDMGCGVRAAEEGAKNVSKKSLMVRVMDALRAAVPAGKMSDNDLRKKLNESLRELDPRSGYVEAIYEKYFVYCIYGPNGYDMEYYKRDYKLSKDGAVTVGSDATEVEPILSYEPTVLEPKVAEAAATGAPCSCKLKAPDVEEERIMADKKARVANLITKLTGLFTAADQAFLEAASDEQLARFEGFTPAPAAPIVEEKKEEVKAKVAEAKPEPKVVETPAKAEPTEAEYLASAPASIRESIEAGLRVGREKKAASIKVLRDSGRCDMTDEQLKGKSQAELDQFVKLADIKVAVDFSGQGAPKVPAGSVPQEAPAVPSLADAIKARRG